MSEKAIEPDMKYTVEVSLYLWGDSLDLDKLSTLLGRKPSSSHRKGDGLGRRFAPTSCWVASDPPGQQINAVSKFVGAFRDVDSDAVWSCGVEDGCIDILVLVEESVAASDRAQAVVEIGVNDLNEIARLRLRTQVTVM